MPPARQDDLPARVVIDPNVYVSAAITPGGTCGKLIDAIDDSAIVALSCPQLLSELQSALLHPKLRRYVSPEEAVSYSRVWHVEPGIPSDATPLPGAGELRPR